MEHTSIDVKRFSTEINTMEAEYMRPTKRTSSFNLVKESHFVRVWFTQAVGFSSDCSRSCLLCIKHPFNHFLRDLVILVILRRLVKHKYQITIWTDS